MPASLENKSWPLFLGCGATLTCAIALAIASWNPTWACIFVASVSTIVALTYLHGVIARFRSPKDYGYHVYAEFGPELRIPRFDRLKEVFPKISDNEVAEWIADFKRVDDLIWQVAQCGGASRVGRARASDLFSQRFEWLSGKGLSTALSRSDYIAWHEGCSDAPPDPQLLAQLFGPTDAS